jgi:SAM-dependent methyltransferase
VTATQATIDTEPQLDPFILPPLAPAPQRPRLLSYVGRWGRAGRWMRQDALRVLDVGCAFGYGSAAILASGPSGRIVVGVERDPGHLETGRRCFPWIRIIAADAAALPFPDGCADAVLMLDMLEHVGDPEPVLAEARRVLRPGGALVLSVPHAGPTRGLDALNLYQALRRRRPSWPPLEAATESDSGEHRHYTAAQLTELLRPRFTVDRIARTGLGLQELVATAQMLLRGPLHAPRLAGVLLPLHLVAYVLDDLIPTGPLAYHLAVSARARGEDTR